MNIYFTIHSTTHVTNLTPCETRDLGFVSEAVLQFLYSVSMLAQGWVMPALRYY